MVGRLIGNEEASLKIRRIDEGGIDGDLCAVISSPGLEVVCLVWPTAGKLKTLKSLAEVKQNISRIQNISESGLDTHE